MLALALAFVCLGCGDDSAATASSTSTTGGSESTGVGSTDVLDPEADTTATTDGTDPEGGECDPFAQDCPEGFTCRPRPPTPAGDDAFCQALPADPIEAGESCPWAPMDGQEDQCGLGLVCVPVDEDNQLGICLEACGGTADAPECPEDTVCLLGVASYTICAPTCHPIDTLCMDGWSCQAPPDTIGNAYDLYCGSNRPDAGGAGSSCMGPPECVAQTMCIQASAVPGCTTERCCSEWCDLEDTEFECTFAAEGQSCIAWADDPPPGFENLGICAVPG